MVRRKDMLDQSILVDIFMKVNLNKVKQMDSENCLGQTEMCILVNGNRIKEMDKENFFSAMDIMKDNSNMVKEKDSDHFFTKMEIYLMVCGI